MKPDRLPFMLVPLVLIVGLACGYLAHVGRPWWHAPASVTVGCLIGVSIAYWQAVREWRKS